MKVLSTIIFCCISIALTSQVIKGNLTLLKNAEIKLEGFNGLKNYTIATTKTDSVGNFKLSYAAKDIGVGYLIADDDKPLFVILCGEDIEMAGEALSFTETIQITKGKENQLFGQYAKEHSIREQALSAWIYLEKIYNGNTLLSSNQKTTQSITQEKARLKTEDATFLNNLPKNSYVRWYLPTRKLVSSVSTIAKYRTQEIPATVAAFRALDHTDKRLYKSGLFKDAIESHFWLLENCGKPLDSVFIEMQTSIDAMINNLVTDEQKLNEVTDYLFDLLERHSLFKASEYLAIKVLNEVSCTINSDLAKQLETYRAMKKGNTAPNIVFPKSTLYPNKNFTPTQLSDIKSPYTLVVFGASWCPKCKEEIPEIAKHYQQWKNNGLEVVFVSLDENEFSFINLGLRVSDVLNLTFEQLKGDEIEIIETKTSKRRVMAINDNIKEALTKFDESFTGLAFKSQKNSVYSTQQINRKLKDIFAKEINKGLHISSHSLRKSFGRHVYNMNNQSENALIKLSELFNHTSSGITRKYLGLRQEELNDIYLSL